MFSTSELSGVHMTAFVAAIMRARHLIVDGHPKILEDPFALQLLGVDADEIVSNTNRYGVDSSEPSSTWILRSRFAEDRLAAARTRNVECNEGAFADLFSPRDGFALPPFRWSDERRPLIRAELDARIAWCYCLARDNPRYIRS